MGHTKHGLYGSRIYKIWASMKYRCKENSKCNKSYGQRGISVCEEWSNNPVKFYEWAINNGYSDELTIDRIDVNGNYEPNNCRWISNREQQSNKRNNKIIEFNGERKTMQQWCEKLNINRSTLLNRIDRGWTIERAFTENVHYKG